jgi:hypothetical protein
MPEIWYEMSGFARGLTLIFGLFFIWVIFVSIVNHFRDYNKEELEEELSRKRTELEIANTQDQLRTRGSGKVVRARKR